MLKKEKKARDKPARKSRESGDNPLRSREVSLDAGDKLRQRVSSQNALLIQKEQLANARKTRLSEATAKANSLTPEQRRQAAQEELRKSREYLRKSTELQAAESESEASRYYGTDASNDIFNILMNWKDQDGLNATIDETQYAKEISDLIKSKKGKKIIEPTEIANLLPPMLLMEISNQNGQKSLQEGLKGIITHLGGVVPKTPQPITSKELSVRVSRIISRDDFGSNV